MKQLIIKYAPLFIAVTALADTQFDLLIQLGLTATAIAWTKLLGLLTALFLPSVKDSFKSMLREDNSDPIKITKDIKKF
jgi:hypothetical protein